MKKLLTSIGFTIAIAGIVFIGCKKEKEPETAPDSSTLYDNSVSDASFTDAGNVADEGATGALSTYRLGGDNRVTTSCATVSIDTPTTGTYKATIDFGTSDCLCKDGNYRKGIVYVTWSGGYRDSAATHSITFNNYYLNFNKIEGTKTVTNNGRNSAGHLNFTTVINGSVTVNPQYSYNGTGGTMTYNSTRFIEWSQGESTLLWWLDDVYLISGTANGTTTKGNSYSMSTSASAPLKVEIGFPNFTSGILNFTQGAWTAAIDYSYLNNGRDNLAMATVNGHTFTIYVGRK